MFAKTMVALLAVAALAGCGGMDGTGGDEALESHGQALNAPIHAPAFWMAVYETEAGQNPFVNRSVCVMGRDAERPVLAGGYVLELNRHFRPRPPVGRHVCEVEAGKPMLMPLVTVSADGAGLEVPPPERVLEARVAAMVSGAKDLRLVIDGKDARSMDLPFVRTGPQSYGYALPASGGLFQLPDGQLDVAPAVADGVFVELPALSPGRHQILVEGMVGSRPFRIEYALDAN